MRNKNWIFNLGLAIVAILFVIYGFKLADKYLSSPSDKDIEEYRLFCDDGQKTRAHFDKEYTETNYKIGKLPSSKIYSIKYFYTVEGVEYSGERVTSNLPNESEIEITYLRSNPSKSIWTKNTCGEYNTIQEKKKSIIYLIIGGIMFLGGLMIINNFFKKFKALFYKK